MAKLHSLHFLAAIGAVALIGLAIDHAAHVGSVCGGLDRAGHARCHLALDAGKPDAEARLQGES